jgi:hypothetical protein
VDDETDDVTSLNTDQLIERFQLDELAEAPLITPVNYGKLYANMTPQKVYYHVRRGHLETVRCPCGRMCVYKDAADKLFEKGQYAPTAKAPDV